MKQALLAIGLAIALMFLPALIPIPESVAQAPSPQQERPPSKVNLTLEQRHVIKEVVKDMNVAKLPETAGTTGTSAPAEAVLRSFPTEITEKVPQIKSHRFFVRGNQIVIVSPDSGEIAEIIE